MIKPGEADKPIMVHLQVLKFPIGSQNPSDLFLCPPQPRLREVDGTHLRIASQRSQQRLGGACHGRNVAGLRMIPSRCWKCWKCARLCLGSHVFFVSQANDEDMMKILD